MLLGTRANMSYMRGANLCFYMPNCVRSCHIHELVAYRTTHTYPAAPVTLYSAVARPGPEAPQTQALIRIDQPSIALALDL